MEIKSLNRSDIYFLTMTAVALGLIILLLGLTVAYNDLVDLYANHCVIEPVPMTPKLAYDLNITLK